MSKVRVTALKHAIASKGPLDDTQAIVARAHVFHAFLNGVDPAQHAACAAPSVPAAATAAAAPASTVAVDPSATDPSAGASATAAAPTPAPLAVAAVAPATSS